MGLPNPSTIETGNDTRIRIRSSEATKEAWDKLCADLDPSLSQEEVIQKLYEEYYVNPMRFE